MALIRSLIFFRNGNVGAFDSGGQQVPSEQRSALEIVVREKLSRGVIDHDTMIDAADGSQTSVAQLLAKWEHRG